MAPTFTAPVGPVTLVFSLVVRDGTVDSVADVVSVVVAGAAEANVARSAAVGASSENVATGQLAVRVVDGFTEGYPTDYTKEWVSLGERAGAWVELSWAAPVSLNRVVLFDRPNLLDQVKGGTLLFSDGSSVSVGELPNDGSGLVVTFPARSVTGVRLTITSASASTVNSGLSEFQAWGTSTVG